MTTTACSIATVLFGDDGSVSADLAWLWLNSHRWNGWAVDVITAEMPTFAAADEQAEPQPWTPRHPRRVFVESGLGLATHLRVDNDPRLALSRRADLLVIGPRGPGLAKALHLGSTAEWLLTRPPSPMLIPRHGRATGAVTVCHDGSAHAAAATAALARMPWIDGMAVTVLVVDDGRTDPTTAIDQASAALVSAGAGVDARVLVGEPTQVILRHVERHATDLLVFGTSGLTGLQRLRVGSTASALAHATDVSILVACDHERVG